MYLDGADQNRDQTEPKLQPAAYGGQTSLSVVIPARNEIHNLPRLLDSLLVQSYIPDEIWVVDDHSTDGTGAIITDYQNRDPRIQGISGQPLPPGWTGKSYALRQGVDRATGEWILFLDADTYLTPHCIGSALALAEAESLSLLSLTANQEAQTLWEQAVQPTIYALLNHQYPLKGAIAANGQFILVNSAQYQACGTHSAVRSQIVEDVALAQAFHQAGLRVAFVNGTEVFRTRMYQDLAGLWEGWSKNSYGLFSPQALTTALQLGIRTVPWMGVGWAFLRADGWGLVSQGAALGVALTCDARIRARQGFDPQTVWLQLPGALLTTGILLNSALKALLGAETTWKGRRYSAKIHS